MNSFEGPAFVICDNAACRYEAYESSPVRITPPYGAEVDVVEDQGDWVLIKWVGKKAWSIRSQLSENKPPERPDKFDITPYIFRETEGPRNLLSMIATATSQVEYGPRGGRFTRTRTGYRRYF